MKLPNNFFATLRSVLFAIILSLGLGYAYAWTGPSGVAPANNTPPPLNEGASDQLKNAGLSLNTLAVFGNALVGKLQLSDVSIEGAVCSPDGTLSRNTTGETLACVSGVWTKGGGYSGGILKYGGSYLERQAGGAYEGTMPLGCVTPNSVTGSCTCPAGYTARYSSQGYYYHYAPWDTHYEGYICEAPGGSGGGSSGAYRMQMPGDGLNAWYMGTGHFDGTKFSGTLICDPETYVSPTYYCGGGPWYAYCYDDPGCAKLAAPGQFNAFTGYTLQVGGLPVTNVTTKW